MAAEECVWKKADYLTFLREGVKLGWWDKEAFKISYDILYNLFECCFEVTGSLETLISKSLHVLDSSLTLPSKMFNLKKKFINMSRTLKIILLLL